MCLCAIRVCVFVWVFCERRCVFDGPIVYRKLRCFLGMPKKYLMVSRAPGVPKVSYFTVSGVLGVKKCRNLHCLGHLGC